MLVQFVKSVMCIAFCFAFSCSASAHPQSTGGIGSTAILNLPNNPIETYNQQVDNGHCTLIDNPAGTSENPLGLIKTTLYGNPVYCKTKTFCTVTESAPKYIEHPRVGHIQCDQVNLEQLLEMMISKFAVIEIEAKQKEAALMKLIIEKDAALSELEKKVNELEMQNK